jgi:hypothetical protein
MIVEIPITASGKYPQGDITPEMVREMVQSYDATNIFAAKIFPGHTSEHLAKGLTQKPVAGEVVSLVERKIGERVYAIAKIKVNEFFNKVKSFLPETSIELYAPNDPTNPTNQDHIPNGKKGKWYIGGVAMLGNDNPAVKIGNAIKELLSSVQPEYEKVSEFKSVQTAPINFSQIKTYSQMLEIAKALGLPETATEAEIAAKVAALVAKLSEMEMGQNKPAPEMGQKPYAETKAKLELAEQQNQVLKAQIQSLNEFKEQMKAKQKTEFREMVLSRLNETAQPKQIRDVFEKHLNAKEYSEQTEAFLKDMLSTLTNYSESTIAKSGTAVDGVEFSEVKAVLEKVKKGGDYLKLSFSEKEMIKGNAVARQKVGEMLEADGFYDTLNN